MNEITRIFSRMDMSVWDVLEAAGTKWNFLRFEPGLVGGHCIGVDPYYLAQRALELDVEPRIILSGREMNDGMADWMADRIHERRGGKAGSALVLGLAFKPDVPDLRNSKVADLIRRLERLGHQVVVYDPLVDTTEARHEYGLELSTDALDMRYDLVVLAVPHQALLAQPERIAAAVAPGGLLADLKNATAGSPMGDINVWTL